MRILLDHCVPRRLGLLLTGHSVFTTKSMGWAALKNGELLEKAEAEFDVFLTVDKNIPNQQNLEERSISLIILFAKNNSIPTLSSLVPQVLSLLPVVQNGQVHRVQQETRQEEDVPPGVSGGEME